MAAMKYFGVRLLAWRQFAIAVAATLGVAVIIVGQWTGGSSVRDDTSTVILGLAVPFAVLGWLVLMSIPRHPVGRLMTAAGLSGGVYLVAASWPAWLPLAWLSQWGWWPSTGLIILAILLFPDGAVPSPRWRPVAGVILAGTAIATITFAVGAFDQPRAFLTDYQTPLAPWAQLLFMIGVGAVLLTLIGALGALGSLWYRWRHADADLRRQLACLLPGAIVFPVGYALNFTEFHGTWAIVGTWAIAAAIAIPLGMTVAILRYRLYDVDLIVNRTIVWLLMTALVLVGFVAIVIILSNVLSLLPRETSSLMAIGLVVVTFQPLHRKVQRGVDRLLYGDRDDPYLVIARLGEVLGRTVDPTAVMPLVTGTIAQSLQVPYVAVELQEHDGPVLVAEHGRPLNMTESFDMVSHGKHIGRLIIARRSTGSRFSRHERRLLRDAALQASVAAEATRLNRDLQTSRERLVTAREEERRRLRRDLHDGLGPSLAGMSMQVRAARKLLPPTDDSRAASILDALATDLKSCTTEVRQLVDELRPPALDRGLDAALHTECRRFNADGLSVRCEVDGSLEGLPAAVEVATFRIVAEALTNVARHSQATICHVRVRRNGALYVEIIDDGIGITSSARAGVGLNSMRERAAELGGDCQIGPAPGGGTSVRLELPFGPVQYAAHNAGAEVHG
ncbi:MAG: GAF domain-containing sensor histidine kinase [Pseudonocardiaceae bacterium]